MNAYTKLFQGERSRLAGVDEMGYLTPQPITGSEERSKLPQQVRSKRSVEN